MNLISQDTTTLITFTLKEDSIRSDETSLNMLGSYVDPDFGYAEANIYTQFKLSSENNNFGTGTIVLDSIILSLVYAGIYGDASQQQIGVYELTDDMSLDDNYYSNTEFSYSTKLADVSFIPNLIDSISVGETKEPTQIRIRLDDTFGQRILTNNSKTNDDFIKLFKGLYIASENTSQDTSKGAIVYLDLLNTYSKLTLFYRNITTVETFSFDLLIDKTCARVNHFVHDYIGTNIQNQLNDSVLGVDEVYIQSMSGVKTKVIMPYINHLTDSGKVLINKAELVLSVVENTTFPQHEKLYVVDIDSLGKNSFLPDQLEGESYYGGTYNSSKKEYRFNITRYIQDVIDNKTKNNGLYIVAAGSAVNANRTILFGANNATSPMKLIIAYSEVN